ncbi:acyl-CoA dehydrogenase family protein [uncultured Serinicoccus sp.]|uniref:acyl-CoA dehydrogenase family protein n=1 Tax=uncultured Serinicoccus sp. TaxID=735514 RepID=UPI002628B5CB|nr:acyl-CoA dehydrogenase family protein [uncultured Serinicoccus sp.]
MRFEPTDEQREFQASVRSLLQRHWSARHLRGAWDGQSEQAQYVWQRLSELGALALLVPEERGGAGASHVELALALEEMGKAGYPLPVGESAGVVADLLARELGRDDELSALVNGSMVAVVSATANAPVPYGQYAERILALRGDEAHLIATKDCGLAAVPTQDPTRGLAMGEIVTGPQTLVAHGAAVGRATTAVWLVQAAELLGLSQRMIDMTRDYVVERRQFGVPIGAFQSLKHQLADCLVQLEAARGLTWYAAYAIDAEPEAALLAARTAKSAASNAAWVTNRVALQLHGGIGFTWEHDLHLWMKRSQALERAHGSTREHRLHIGRQLVDKTLAG